MGQQVKRVLENQLKPILLLSFLMLAGCSSALSGRTAGSQADLATATPGNALAFQSDKDFGKGLSQRERSELTAAELKAFEFGNPGEPVKWGGGRARVSGSVVVTQPFRVGQSSCRRFSHRLERSNLCHFLSRKVQRPSADVFGY